MSRDVSDEPRGYASLRRSNRELQGSRRSALCRVETCADPCGQEGTLSVVGEWKRSPADRFVGGRIAGRRGAVEEMDGGSRYCECM